MDVTPPTYIEEIIMDNTTKLEMVNHTLPM